MAREVNEEEIVRAVERYKRLRGQGTLANMLVFGRVLKDLGFRLGLSQVIDANRSLPLIDIQSRPDFHRTLAANLLHDHEDIALFDQVFEAFWQGDMEIEPAMETMEVPAQSSDDSLDPSDDSSGTTEETVAEQEGAAEEGDPDADPLLVPTYSPNELLNEKDFSEMGIEESRAVTQAILLIASKIATQVSRRKKRARRGTEIDPRGTMRRNIKYGGELVELVARKRRIKKTRVVLLCDVSGSMDCYSRFLIQFMYGLQNELWGVETFVFSTTLSRITHLIRTKNIGNALEKISKSVLGWSGGTNIGRSLEIFNRDFAVSMVTHRTVVVIISDGWDRGDVGVLERQMQALKRRCGKMIWLNPLLASENYEPLCKGMQAALPYLDLFLSAHNANSLVHLGHTMRRLVA
ncbi:MAG: VWA domain-containing protein [Deltaproteobacteria bacterium]|nr:VWA domain-containing protein [Deltaproteobacteria bacterium]